ncbi:galectin-7 [Nephila pilipes]|uniref:Galectin n=1 Tax=Nephila pilipes TaxID=299642 RepID=A0A8X6NB63_NEPPI|nr:galectin-7 [Nephila pilipes]
MYHFNPRFPENSIVCNNRCADSWGEEQSLEGSPIVPGERVTVVIVAAREGFIPFVNGNPLPSFAHRLDVCAACTVVIDGDIRLDTVTFDSPPTTPVTMALPCCFGPGKGVYVSGKVSDSASRFEINLQCGEGDSDIALHFNPRFDSSELVLNSRNEGNWDEEIREPNPIAPGSDVEIYILCQDSGYVIIIDGDVVIGTFPHRIDSGRVSHVNVDGSITVHRILGV